MGWQFFIPAPTFRAVMPMHPARMSPIWLFKSTGLCAMVLWLAACSAEVDAIHAMTTPTPLPAPDLSFTCVHSRDADIPVTPEAQALFDKARALEKAPGPRSPGTAKHPAFPDSRMKC